jgi:DNA-binding response OmpR family regulator
LTGRRRILVVEDDIDLRQIYRLSLALDGFEVLEAGDGLDALRLIEQIPPDLVILDLGLPVFDGFSVRREISAHAYTREIPVVVVTGLAVHPDSLDAACILYKPVMPEQLVQTVRSCLVSGAGGVASF